MLVKIAVFLTHWQFYDQWLMKNHIAKKKKLTPFFSKYNVNTSMPTLSIKAVTELFLNSLSFKANISQGKVKWLT